VKDVFKLCGILATLSIVFLLITYRSLLFIYGLLQWLPLFFFPLVMVQTYAQRFSTLLPLLFTNPFALRQAITQKQDKLNLYYPYFAICLMAASASNRYGIVFYGIMVALVALFLWTLRPRRSTPMLWVCLFLLGAGIGFGGHLQLHHLQVKLEQQAAPWLSGLSGESVDPYQSNMRVGSIGDLK
jgi:hypothetical protein